MDNHGAQTAPMAGGPSSNAGLGVNDLYSEDGPFYYVKGWQDKEAFAAEVKREFLEEEITPEGVTHGYVGWRVGPTDDGPGQLLRIYGEPGRGRFKATYWTDA